ncbi:hypothetical protein [uncultured Salipiger sp.]|uniref:hypothetical protein n=1 Tax=uncultured Salipiger sp. TaxID=499810 RepID=UPI0025986B0A|nr:hypothetical protein [uncultured Salipiger sp.]
MLKLYEGHFLDLLNDLGQEQGLADINASIGSRLPQPDTVVTRNRDAASLQTLAFIGTRIPLSSHPSARLQEIRERRAGETASTHDRLRPPRYVVR